MRWCEDVPVKGALVHMSSICQSAVGNNASLLACPDQQEPSRRGPLCDWGTVCHALSLINTKEHGGQVN